MEAPGLEVAILVQDLDDWVATVQIAHKHSIALDLAENYRRLPSRQDASKLTKMLESTLRELEAYSAFARKEIEGTEEASDEQPV
jgi:hypothetical protein